jgi:hypothetical protein
LKTKIAIIALFLAAALSPPAHAGLVMLNTTLPAVPKNGGLGTSADLYLSAPPGYASGCCGYLVAAGYDNLFPSTSATSGPVLSGASHAQLDEMTDGGGKLGLGLNSNDSPYVGPTDGIVFDLSHVESAISGDPLTQITFNMYQDITGDAYWVVFGMSGANGTGTAKLIASGPTSTVGAMTVTTNVGTYKSFIIGESNDCALDVQGVSLEYETPELGTMAMSGMSLMGLGAALRRRKRALTGRG